MEECIKLVFKMNSVYLTELPSMFLFVVTLVMATIIYVSIDPQRQTSPIVLLVFPKLNSGVKLSFEPAASAGRQSTEAVFSWLM